MKKWLGLLSIWGLLLPGLLLAEEVPTSLTGVTVIEVEMVKQWLDKGVAFTLIDARKASEFEDGHLPEAESCPVNLDRSLGKEAIQLAVQHLHQCPLIKELNQNENIVVYCNAPS